MTKIYKLGPHILLCGDANEIDSFKKLLGDEKINLCVTSPPYNQGLNARLKQIKNKNSGGMYKNNKRFLLKMANAYHDDKDENQYQQEQITVLNNIYNVLAGSGSIFYNHKIRYRNKHVLHPLMWINKTKLILRQEIIWDKGHTMILNARMFLPIDERLYWLVKSTKFYFDDKAKKYSTIWPIYDGVTVKNDCLPFPNKIAYRCIMSCSKPGDIVLDCYGGTGTTLIMSEKLKRRARLIEIDEARCERIIDRWEKYRKDPDGQQPETA